MPQAAGDEEGGPVAAAAAAAAVADVGGAGSALRRRTLPRGAPAFSGRLWRKEAFEAAAEGGAVPSSPPQMEDEERHNLEGEEKRRNVSCSVSLHKFSLRLDLFS